MIDTKKLREIAKAATPGMRIAYDNFIELENHDGPRGVIFAELFGVNPIYGDSSNDTHFIAVFDPATALELLDRIEALEAENRRLRDALREISEWSDDPESVSIAREALNHGIKPEEKS